VTLAVTKGLVEQEEGPWGNSPALFMVKMPGKPDTLKPAASPSQKPWG